MLESDGKPIGTPINISIPQYAYHSDEDTGNKTPGLIIQAEQAAGHQIIGFRTLPDAEIMAATLEEFEVLGQERPSDL